MAATARHGFARLKTTGIGRATAAMLAASAHRVLATALSQTSSPTSTLPGPTRGCDVDSIASAVAAMLERFGGIDVLDNTAGCALRGASRRWTSEPSNAWSA